MGVELTFNGQSILRVLAEGIEANLTPSCLVLHPFAKVAAQRVYSENERRFN